MIPSTIAQVFNKSVLLYDDGEHNQFLRLLGRNGASLGMAWRLLWVLARELEQLWRGSWANK